MLHLQGHCPQCGQLITPNRSLQANILRRDVLECPDCHARILKCRMPGCLDYALGGRRWDNDLCPDCTKKVTRTALAGGLAIALGSFFGRRQLVWPPYIQR